MDWSVLIFHIFIIYTTPQGFDTLDISNTTVVSDSTVEGVAVTTKLSNLTCFVQTDDTRYMDVSIYKTGESNTYVYKAEMPQLSGIIDTYVTCLDGNDFAVKRESAILNKIFEPEYIGSNVSYHPWTKEFSIAINTVDYSIEQRNVTCSFKHRETEIEILGNVGSGDNITHTFTCEDLGAKNGVLTISINCTCDCSVAYQTMTQDVFIYFDVWSRDFFDEVYKTPTYTLTAKTNKDKMVTSSLSVKGMYKANATALQTRWTIYTLNGDIVNNEISDKNQSSIIIPADTVTEGTYKVELEVNITVFGETVSFTDFLYLIYTFPDILPEITVNNVVNYIRKISLIGDEDPSAIVISTQGTRDPAEGLLNVGSSSTTKSMLCGTNSDFTEEDMLKALETEVIDGTTNLCSDLIPSEIDTFSIGIENLVVNQWYLFKLTVSRGLRQSSIFQAIQVIDKKVPALYIQSVTNSYKTSSNIEKISQTDLQVNMMVDVDEIELRYVSYFWKFETLVNGNTVDVVATGIAPGFKISKEVFEQWPSAAYRLSCRVKSPSYSDVTTYKSYSMNYAPYGGNCSLQVEDIPVVTGVTKVCITCSDWKDEGVALERDVNVDTGGSLLYAPVQLFLTADRQVNTSINELMHAPLGVLARCFTIAKPPNTVSNYTRIEVRIFDELEAPYAKVLFDDIQIQYHTIGSGTSGADDVNALIALFTRDLINAVQLNDVLSLTDTGQILISELQVKFPGESPTMPFTDYDTNTGGLTDILSNGTALSLGDVISELGEQEVDPLVQALQDANENLVTSLYEVVLNKTIDLNLLEVLQVAKTLLITTSTSEIKFNDQTLVLLVQLTKYVFNVTESVTYETTLKEDLITTCIGLVNSLADVVVPDTFSGMENDATLETQRQRNADAFRFASDATLQKMEEEALMFDDERSWYFSKQLSIIKYTIDKRRNIATELSEIINRLYVSLVENSKISFGAEVVIGDNFSYAKMVTETTERLAGKTIVAATTHVSFDDFVPSPNEVLKIGLMETYSIINIDKDGSASKITSYQKELVIENQDNNDIPNTVTILHKVATVESKVHTPMVHKEDASKFDYHIVEMKKSDDDLFVNIEPLSGIEASYSVYILFTHDDDTHVSKKDHTAVRYSTAQNYIAHFPATILGGNVGVWQVGIETVLENSNWRNARFGDDADTHVSNGSYLDYPAFKIATVSAGCMTWNKLSKSWGTNDCQSTWMKTTSELECKCRSKKEMTFANSFYVAPNKIDYKTVFLKFSPLSQAAVIGVLFIIFVAYIIILSWAIFKDKTDLIKWGITPLNDNIADDNYFYVIKVFTGMRPKSGTRSRVSFVIGGEEMDTGIRQLDDGVRKEFLTGSVLQFLMSTSLCLGDLLYVRIWHDNSGFGNHASWYLSKIEVEDIQRNEKFAFVAGKWLANDEYQDQLDCVIPVSKNESMDMFKYRVINNAKENIAESHAWLSVVYRPQTSNFTRKQRASCALLFIMLTLVANAMFFKGSNEENYELPSDFEIGPFRFSLHQAYQSLITVLIVTPVTLLVVYLFKLSRYCPVYRNKPLFDKPTKKSRDFRIPLFDTWLEKERKRNAELERKLIQKGHPEIKGFTLPNQCIYLAWTLLVLATLISAFYVVLFSMEWGKQKSEEWVTMLLLSIIQSIFCVDPVKILLMAVLFAILFRKMSSPSIQISRSHVIKYFSVYSRKKIDRSRTPAPTIDTTKLMEARENHAKDIIAVNKIYDAISSVVLIWILLSISNASIDSRSYKLHEDIENTLANPSDTASFSKIQTTSDFYSWLNDTAITNTFPETNINTKSTPLHWRERQYIAGGHLFRVGPPRLRQLRIAKGTCRYSYVGSVDCYKSYRIDSEDTGSYCFGWGKGECSQKATIYNYSSAAWRYTPSLDIWGLPVVGHFATYSGGGYIAKLSVNRQVSQIIVAELYKNIWIDRETRAVLFELTLYSPNTNIFTYCIFMVEFPETGGTVTTYSIFPLRLYLHLGPSGMYTLACEVCFILYLMLFSINVAVKLLKQKRAFLKDSWQVFDFFFAVGSYVTIAMVIVQLELTYKSLAVFREDKKEFVNFQHIAIWNQVVVLSVGILVFMAIIRMLKIFGYTQRIKVLANVFSKASKDLISFAAFFIFTFVSYAALGYLLFGFDIKAYQNVVKTMETLFISILGKSRFAEVEETDPVMAKVYFMLFVGGVVYLMMTIFFAILCAAIDEAHKISTNENGTELVNRVFNKFLRFIGLDKSRSSTAVTPITIHVKPKEEIADNQKEGYNDAKDVLVDIRTIIYEAMLSDQRDFTTPSDEKRMKKVRFRR